MTRDHVTPSGPSPATLRDMLSDSELELIAGMGFSLSGREWARIRLELFNRFDVCSFDRLIGAGG